MEEDKQQTVEEAGSPEILNSHKVKVQNNNGGSRIDIPTEIENKVNIEPGDIAEIRANKGDHGKYVEFWVPKKQEGEK